MSKIFISQPMRGKTREEILEERNKAIEEVEQILGQKVDVIDTVFDLPENAKPLEYLGESIKCLSQADVAVFIGDWRNARGCRIENECARKYWIPVIEK